MDMFGALLFLGFSFAVLNSSNKIFEICFENLPYDAMQGNESYEDSALCVKASGISEFSTDANSFQTEPPDVDSLALFDLLDEFPIDKNIQCPENDAQFPYPGDCSRYITCKNYEAHIRQCPPGLYFDSLYLYCRQNIEAICDEEDIERKHLCGTDEEYLECGLGCEKTCSNFEKYAFCSDVCVQGCFCKSGLVRGPLRLCIPSKLCSETNSLFPWFMKDLREINNM